MGEELSMMHYSSNRVAGNMTTTMYSGNPFISSMYSFCGMTARSYGVSEFRSLTLSPPDGVWSVEKVLPREASVSYWLIFFYIYVRCVYMYVYRNSQQYARATWIATSWAMPFDKHYTRNTAYYETDVYIWWNSPSLNQLTTLNTSQQYRGFLVILLYENLKNGHLRH